MKKQSKIIQEIIKNKEACNHSCEENCPHPDLKCKGGGYHCEVCFCTDQECYNCN
jgi:hypothetical protein